jgi:hypothetical protein
MANKYFLTVDWCNKGRRGVFCDQSGNSFWKEEVDGPHTEQEMWDVLGMFDIILDPQSILLSEEELYQYKWFVPLAEYTDHFGIAMTDEVFNKEIPDVKAN